MAPDRVRLALDPRVLASRFFEHPIRVLPREGFEKTNNK